MQIGAMRTQITSDICDCERCVEIWIGHAQRCGCDYTGCDPRPVPLLVPGVWVIWDNGEKEILECTDYSEVSIIGRRDTTPKRYVVDAGIRNGWGYVGAENLRSALEGV
jgi:hypothetical protein